jgi:flagellum-specific ATP synthase
MLTLEQQLDAMMPARVEGRIVRIVGLTAAAADFPAPVGAVVEVESQTGEIIEGEVIGFRDDLTLLSLLKSATGLRHGNRVRLTKTKRTLRAGQGLLGRVIDARGDVIDGKPRPALPERIPLDREPTSAVDRPRIDMPLSTGVQAIDGLLTCGKGQRMGIFAGSGVGKSVTLGMMARYTAADISIIALIGERGREVNEFIERDLTAAGLARSVVVVATSDEPALLRVQAAFAATTLAEYFRDQGHDVLLMMDSLTRLALAQREIGLAAGEPPTTRGYPPSVFALFPRLLERAGRTPRGSITGFYSVLVEGDDPNEPVADTARGLLDGHTWLSRKLAAKGHFPAIDILDSISRLMTEVADPDHRQAAQSARELLAAYREHEDLISIGAYRRGSNRVVDLAIDLQGPINEFLRQAMDKPSGVAQAREKLLSLYQARQQRELTLAAAPAAGGGVAVGGQPQR